MFDSIDDDDLLIPCGGVTMRLTQYGYRNDPYLDRETRAGHGAYHNLVRGESLAMTDSGLRALGITHAFVRQHRPWVSIKLKGGGTLFRRIDDRCPNGDGRGHLYRQHRADLYQPGGYNSRLPDYADVQLIPRAIPVHGGHR